MTHALAQRLRGLSADDSGWSMARRIAAANKILAPLAAYPDQMALARDLSRGEQNVGVLGTRRSGKTDAIARWILAKLICCDHFVVRLLTNTLHAPTENILARASDGGIVAILRGLGLVDPTCKVRRVGTKQSVVEILFSWGSVLTVNDIGSTRAIGNKHGFSGDVFWIDEVTKTPLAEYALANLVSPVLADSHGVVVLSYTPDEELDSLPALIARSANSNYLPHHFRAWCNPHFGPTFAIRWARLCDGIDKARDTYQLNDGDIARLRGLSQAECDAISLGTESDELRLWVEGDPKDEAAGGLDPELLRNWFGRWVRMASAYVYYPFHRMPPEALYWCAVSDATSHGGRFPVSVTMSDRLQYLPAYPIPGASFRWRATIAADIGTRPNPYSTFVRVWSHEHPVVYELHSRKERDLDDDDMLADLCGLIEAVQALRVGGESIPIDRVIADLTGMRKGTLLAWDRRIKARFPLLAEIGVIAPLKPEKLPRIRLHNLDMKAGRHRYIAGGCCDVEGRNLRYKADKPAEIHKDRKVKLANGDTIEPGNDATDAAMYADHRIPILHTTKPPVAQAARSPYRNDYAKMRGR